MVSVWRSLNLVTKVILIIVAILALWALSGTIDISTGGSAGPSVPASAR